jgi:hypothetical protein
MTSRLEDIAALASINRHINTRGGYDESDLFAPGPNSRGYAERAWLRRMPADRRHMGAFTTLSNMRSCRLLRFEQEQTRDKTFL